MLIGIPKETLSHEKRVAVVPSVAQKLIRLGFQVAIEKGAGESAGFPDALYENAGVQLFADALSIYSSADLVLRINAPDASLLARLKEKASHISFLGVEGREKLLPLFEKCSATVFDLARIPRITRAQSMDVLSSQASLAGYVAVILCARYLPKVFPMMMTSSGTISPSRVFVIGAGVAGLQAIATAKRLGAKVEAFDTRPGVDEQVRSLGASFLTIDLGEREQTEQGYAKALTPEQEALQRKGMKEAIAQSDIVITTAQLVDRPAPLLVTDDMLEAMQPGSVVLDMAVDSGGNVQGSKQHALVDVHGVTIIGYSNLPSYVAKESSTMLSNNLMNLLGECWDQGAKEWNICLENDILSKCVLSHLGERIDLSSNK